MTDTTFSLAQLLPAMPEIYLTFAICALLMFDVFVGVTRRGATGSFALLLLLGGAVVTLLTADIGTRQVILGGMYVADDVATLLKLSAFLFTAVALYYSGDYLQRRGLAKGEYHVLALTALLGILVLASAANLLTVYIGIELLSLSLYALVAIDRDNGIAAEAAMKYFVLGAIASGTLLYGMSLLYGLTGTLELGAIGAALSGKPSLGMILALAFVVVAVAFKFGAAPFHMWVPDVYQGAPTSVALLVASAPKIASFAFAFRLLAEGLGPISAEWAQMLSIVAVISLVLGNVIAIAQTSIRRMLAYSAIGNVGFVLLGFVAGGATGYQSALFFTLVYVLMVLAAFGVLLQAGREGFEAEELDHFKGLSARDPALAVILAIVMFSSAGVPPFAGFWAKLRVIEALVGTNHVWLAAISVLVSVIGAFYYLRVVWLMYFDKPGDLPQPARAPALRLVLGVNAAAILALGILPDALLEVCRQVILPG